MNNPFKKILFHQEVPIELKQKVLNDINLIKLLMDISDLFLIKFPSTLHGILNTNQNKKKDD
mgnify:FL=1|tara:strand:+ start:353 stop:538 length:186 start_codon:yes stop_codon:yes gene_type:complete